MALLLYKKLKDVYSILCSLTVTTVTHMEHRDSYKNHSGWPEWFFSYRGMYWIYFLDATMASATFFGTTS